MQIAAPASPPPVAPSKPRNASQPDEIPSGAWQYVDAFESATQEPPELKGVVYRQEASGTVEILKWSGETKPEPPPDIPADAVKNGRVVIYVDGIHQMWGEQQRQINHLLHGSSGHGANVDQPVIGIHEGAGKSGFRDGVRIAKAMVMTKLVQAGVVPLKWAQKKLYKIDPAIKAVHDQLSQSLQEGRQVQLMTHSGGGQETAAALALLAREGYKKQISENVRVLSLASAAAKQDFTKSGVKQENLYYTGSKKDPVYSIFRHHLHLTTLPINIPFWYDVARYLTSLPFQQPGALAVHSPDYIFAKNVNEEGRQRIDKFLAGGPGGAYPLP